MAIVNSETTRKYLVNSTLEIKITDFSTAGKSVFKLKPIGYKHFAKDTDVYFCARVSTNGILKATEGWLVVVPFVKLYYLPEGFLPPHYSIVSCTVSVLDVEGNTRFPQSFERLPSEKDAKYVNYLERSFILSKKDELLPKDTLTVVCDIYFDLNSVGTSFDEDSIHRSYIDYIYSVPRTECTEKKATTEEPYASFGFRWSTFIVGDFTSQILTLPQFHESRKRFGVYDFPPEVPTFSSVSKVDLEHVWIFNTDPDRFLLSLDKRQDGVGARLLNASPLIRRMVNVPMRERRERCIEFPDIESWVFSFVLYYLEEGSIPSSVFCYILPLYKASHFLQMQVLQWKCAEEMVKSLRSTFDVEELKRTASMYSDEHLSELMKSRLRKCEKLEQLQLKIDDRPDYDSYI